MKAVNQTSGLETKARFYSAEDRSQVTPTTAHWRLTDDETGEVLQDWTSLEIAEGDDPYALVEVSGTLNTVPRNRNYSIKRLTVAADRGEPREYSKSVTYRVNRLR